MQQRIDAMFQQMKRANGWETMPTFDQDMIADQLDVVLTCRCRDYATIGKRVLLAWNLQNSTIGLGPIDATGLIAPTTTTTTKATTIAS